MHCWIHYNETSATEWTQNPKSERSKTPQVNLTRVLRRVGVLYSTIKLHKIHSSLCRHLYVLKPLKSNISFPTINNSSQKILLKIAVMLCYGHHPRIIFVRNTQLPLLQTIVTPLMQTIKSVGLYYHIRINRYCQQRKSSCMTACGLHHSLFCPGGGGRGNSYPVWEGGVTLLERTWDLRLGMDLGPEACRTTYTGGDKEPVKERPRVCVSEIPAVCSRRIMSNCCFLFRTSISSYPSFFISGINFKTGTGKPGWRIGFNQKICVVFQMLFDEQRNEKLHYDIIAQLR